MHELTEKPIKGLFPDDSTSGTSKEFSLYAPLPRQPRANRASPDRRTLSRRRAPQCASSARARRRAAATHSAYGGASARLRRHKGKLVHLTNVVQTYFGNLMAEFEGDLANIHSLEEKQAPLGARRGSGELCSDGSAATG